MKAGGTEQTIGQHRGATAKKQSGKRKQGHLTFTHRQDKEADAQNVVGAGQEIKQRDD